MPELPEVETVRRGVAPLLEGHEIRHAEARRPDLRWPLPKRFAARLKGRRVGALRRRSKYILADLDATRSAPAETWIIHLGMSGRFIVTPNTARGQAGMVGDFVHDTGAQAESPHDHVVIDTDAGRLTYNDPRRFGAMDLCPTSELDAHRLLSTIGPEPLGNEFHADHLAERLHNKTASIKSVLLDQKVVAGLGNIYVCEALHRTGIDPRRPAGGLSRERLDLLVDAIRAVLAEAIEAGGSTLRDYRQADGDLGYFQHSFAVYGREGAPCSRQTCPGEVRRFVQNGRSSFYCPACQT